MRKIITILSILIPAFSFGQASMPQRVNNATTFPGTLYSYDGSGDTTKVTPGGVFMLTPAGGTGILSNTGLSYTSPTFGLLGLSGALQKGSFVFNNNGAVSKGSNQIGNAIGTIRGLYATDTMTAHANNDIEITMDLQSLYRDSTFTGVKHYSIRPFAPMEYAANYGSLFDARSVTDRNWNDSAYLQNQNSVFQTFNAAISGNINMLYVVTRNATTSGGSPHWSMQNGSTQRWAMGLNATEGGSNTGSNWYLARANDAGALQDFPITANRATGLVTFADGVSVAGGATIISGGATIWGMSTGATTDSVVTVLNGQLRRLLHVFNNGITNTAGTTQLGGNLVQNTTINTTNTYSLVVSNASPTATSGFRVDLTTGGGDAGWDMFTRDSVTTFWKRIPKGTYGQILSQGSNGPQFISAPFGTMSLIKVAGINQLSNGSTYTFTTQTGRGQFVITNLTVMPKTVTGSGSFGSYSIGNNASSYNNILAGGTTGATPVVNNSQTSGIQTSQPSLAANTTYTVLVSAGSGFSALTYDLYIWGFYEN